MRNILLPIFIALVCVSNLISVSTNGQEPQSGIAQAKPSKEELKRAAQQRRESERLAEAGEKDAKRRAKQAEKERLERPAQITINASAERVKSIFVARTASNGATIEEASDYRIVFSKRITGMKGAFAQALLGNAYSEQPKYTATLVLAEIEKGKTLVTLSDIAISVRMALGNVNRVDYTKDKKTRVEADSMLEQLKQAAESQEQESAKQTSPQQPSGPSVLSAEGYNQAGVGLFAQRKYGEAEGAFREAIRLDPYNAAYHFNLGTSLSAQSRFDEAEKEIELATRLAPNDESYKKGLEVVRANKNSKP